ncbi:MAG: heme-binding protein [Lachnospiraceae bacterium]|nr:heme-binding protein [Lachnospiraceae bacterium]
MTVEEVLKILEMQEEVLQFSHFTHADAWAVGNAIVAEASRRDLAVAVSIRLNNGSTVFQYEFDGTGLDNEHWMQRKMNTVKYKEMSSLRAYTELQVSGETLDDWAMDPREFAICGGGFPIRVEEVGVIGVILVSGLEHVADHDLIIKCISKYLHVDEIPRIRGSF